MRSLTLCCSQVSVKKKNYKKDKSCTFPEHGRRVLFTKPELTTSHNKPQHFAFNEGEGVHVLITCVILMMIDIVMHRQGRVTWKTTRFWLIKLFCQLFCICYWVVVLAIWSSMVRMLKILTDAYISHIVRGQSTLKDVIEHYFWNG